MGPLGPLKPGNPGLPASPFSPLRPWATVETPWLVTWHARARLRSCPKSLVCHWGYSDINIRLQLLSARSSTVDKNLIILFSDTQAWRDKKKKKNHIYRGHVGLNWSRLWKSKYYEGIYSCLQKWQNVSFNCTFFFSKWHLYIAGWRRSTFTLHWHHHISADFSWMSSDSRWSALPADWY